MQIIATPHITQKNQAIKLTFIEANVLLYIRFGAVAQLGERSYRQVVGSIKWIIAHLLFVLCFGAVAQLGERLNGIQEVVGSIPISSTKKTKG